VRLLIVEDERRLAVALAKGLAAEGFAVDVVHDGAEGLRLAGEHAYDLLVLDIMLPGLNGYRVCAALRAAGNDVPILMLTAKDGEYDEAEGLDTGADDYLTKPFSYLVLVARIKALLRRRGSAGPSPVVRFGALTVDTAARRVFRADVEVALTAKEFAVLEQLVVRPGEIVTKAHILEHVWDFAYDGDPNIIEVYIIGWRHRHRGGPRPPRPVPRWSPRPVPRLGTSPNHPGRDRRRHDRAGRRGDRGTGLAPGEPHRTGGPAGGLHRTGRRAAHHRRRADPDLVHRPATAGRRRSPGAGDHPRRHPARGGQGAHPRHRQRDDPDQPVRTAGHEHAAARHGHGHGHRHAPLPHLLRGRRAGRRPGQRPGPRRQRRRFHPHPHSHPHGTLRQRQRR
jgi:DNA-binding response OmpR family regulator